MNWAKGRGTRGRGTSFKGALLYVLHDQNAATSGRVGFVALSNMATDDPNQAWREMMGLCQAADELKKRAGVKATGRRLTKPVYSFSLNWHEADNPEPAHMLETAYSALKALGMEDNQAVIVEHTDRPHKHVHVIVNVVDPGTGRSVSISNDEHKLDRWADDYEQTQGIIRSPQRRAKFQALDNGVTPPKRTPQARTRDEWQAARSTTRDGAARHAAAIRAAHAARVADFKERYGGGHEARKAETERLWQTYRADRQAVADRYKPFIDAVWKRTKPASPSSGTEHALKNIEESAQWKALGRAQFAERSQFDARETSLLGQIGNAIRLYRASRGKSRGLTDLFRLVVSGAERRERLAQQQESGKQELHQRQTQTRTERAATLKTARNVELATLSQNFDAKRRQHQSRHLREMADQKEEWKRITAENSKAWAEFRSAFGVAHAERGEKHDHQSLAGKFAEASADHGGRSAGEAPPKGSPEPAKARTGQQQGWRARRPAAERKADGSYKERDRDGGSRIRDRGREQSRYDPN